jgi:tRNA modification GTPase
MDSSCPIAKKSINHSLGFLEKADLVLFVLDSSRRINKTDISVAGLIKNKKVIIVINKSDLACKLDMTPIKKLLPNAARVTVSALQRKGFHQLEKKIIREFFQNDITQNGEVLVSSVRQKNALQNCYRALHNAIGLLANKAYEECLIFEIKQALSALGEVVGRNIDEDVLNNIFSRFCIGK